MLEVLTAVSAATGAVKDLMAMAKTAANQEMMGKLIDLREELLNVRAQGLALQEENAALKKSLELEHQLTFDGRVYWRHSEGEERDGPFCQCCWDGSQKLIRLQSITRYEEREWICRVCEKVFAISRPE